MFLCTNLHEKSDFLTLPQFFDGVESVFYIPKNTHKPMDKIEQLIGCRAVELKREKVTVWKYHVKIFPKIEEKPKLEISYPVSFTHCQDFEPLHMRIMSLRKSLKALGKEIARRDKTIRVLSRKPVDTLTTPATDSMESREPTHTTLFEAILTEMTNLYATDKHGRRFSELLAHVSELLFSLSPRCYRVLRQIFPLPSLTTLFGRYGGIVNEIQATLTDIERIDNILQEMASHCSSCEENMFTLAIDAFACRTFSAATVSACGSTKETGNKECDVMTNGFMFLLIPVWSEQPVRLIHIEARPTGNYDRVIAALAQRIKEKCAHYGIKIWFKAADGDRFLAGEHREFFEDCLCSYDRKLSFTEVTDAVYDQLRGSQLLSLPIADPLHFAKNARSKLVNHAVVVQSDDSELKSINGKQLEEILQLGKPFQDTSQLAAMRDTYATDIFHLTNVAKLIKKECLTGAFTLLPFSCLFAVLFEPNLRNETRVMLVDIAYNCFWHFLTELDDILKKHPTVKIRYVAGAEATTLTEDTYLARTIHTCVAFGIVLRHGPRNVRLDALGTHLVENRIGNARGTCNDPRWTRIMSNCSLGELWKILAGKLDLSLHWSKRINCGGAKVDTLADAPIGHPDSWDAEKIVSLIAKTLRSQDQVDPKLNTFADELSDLAQQIRKPTIGNPGPVANSLIMARNISFGAGLWKGVLDIQDDGE